MAETFSFTCRILEHEQIEASYRHPLLEASLKNFFDIKISGNNSTDNYNDNNKKKIVISMYQDSGLRWNRALIGYLSSEFPFFIQLQAAHAGFAPEIYFSHCKNKWVIFLCHITSLLWYILIY